MSDIKVYLALTPDHCGPGTTTADLESFENLLKTSILEAHPEAEVYYLNHDGHSQYLVDEEEDYALRTEILAIQEAVLEGRLGEWIVTFDL